MDDNFRNEPGYGENRNSGSAGKKSRNGDFKVSIDFNDDQGSSNSSPKSNTQSSGRENDKFRVSIPEQNTQKRDASKAASGASPKGERPHNGSARTSSAARSTAKPRATAQPSAKRGATGAAADVRKKAGKGKADAARKNGNVKKKLTPEQIKKAKERAKYQRIRGALIICTCLIVIAIITTAVSSIALSAINDILAIRKQSGEAVSIVIPDDANFDQVFDILADNGLVKQKTISKLFCKFRHYDSYTDKNGDKVNVKYDAGVYYIDPDKGIESMLETIKTAKNLSKDTVRLTFPEGWSIARIFEKIEKYNVCTAEKLYANLEVAGKDFKFYEKIPSNTGRYLKAEGYLFPDTYDFYIGESATSVLKKLFSNFESKWDSSYDTRLKDLGMTEDEIIIIASIIQREAKNKSQMKDISAVLHNRLKNPTVYPRLEMNSTKDYITSIKEYGVLTDFYFSVYLEAYNTYSKEGLPPGAICNPGNDAIYAALYPSETDYCFFCHDSDGEIYLAKTADEHKANVAKIFSESD